MTEQELRDTVVLLVAHVENLIERVLELEEQAEVLMARLKAVERATPWQAPAKPKPPKLPPRR